MEVSIRPWKIEDAKDLAAAINNTRVLDNLRDGIPYPYAERDAIDFIHEAQSAFAGTQYPFAITVDGKVIGSLGVFRNGNVHRLTAEMGYFIAEAYWGKGIMTEAVSQACAFIFKYTDILRIYAEPYAFNKASCRVLEKAGFQLEGTLRQNAQKNGRIVDMLMYAKLRTYPIRRLSLSDMGAALELVWQVFAEFDAPDFTDEGIEEFKASIAPAYFLPRVKRGEYRLWGAYDNDFLAGVIATRAPMHISLLFVDRQYHRRGLARALLQAALEDAATRTAPRAITVNSSPYAVEIYRHMGFVPTEMEQTRNGLRFTPMQCILA